MMDDGWMVGGGWWVTTGDG